MNERDDNRRRLNSGVRAEWLDNRILKEAAVAAVVHEFDWYFWPQLRVFESVLGKEHLILTLFYE